MKKILFIRLRLLGDIVFTIPALEIFKHHYPKCKLYFVVEDKFQEIAHLIPTIDEVIILPRNMSIKEHFDFKRKIKNLGIDTVIDFHSGPKSALLTRLSGANTRIGYRTPNRNWAYNHLTPRTFSNKPTHSTYNQAKLLEHLGISIDTIPYYPEIALDDSIIGANVKEILKKNSSKNIVTIHVGAGNRFRDWGFENFSTLIKQLTSDETVVFLVGHSQEEREKARKLEEKHNVYNQTGKLSIAETLYLISGADVYFGVDSGPLHLASLTETPIVTLYGPNLPEISGPWREKNITIIQLPLECRPCSQRKCIFQKSNDQIKCMKHIQTDEVYEAINRYIK